MTFKISLKWGKELVPVEVDTNESISVLKMQIYSLTRVPPEGQKIMVPRVGALREDMPWSKYNLKDGVVWMLVGTAEDQQLQKPEATVFMEDIASTAVKVFKHKGGLANLGNTCYLNSSVQLLASVPELQKRLSTYRPDVQGGAEARVVSSFRQVINDLDKRDQVIPFDFVQVFRDAFPQFAEQSEGGGYAQQDADESLSALIRCLGQVSGLEKEGSSAGDLVTQLFTGSMQTTSKCIEAEDEPPESETTTFNKLSCHISSTTNFLHEGLCKYSPALDRDAQYAKSSRIAKLPPYLCVQFVRFWWNDKAKVKAKISRV